MTLSGARLLDAKELMTDSLGFEVVKIEPVNANQIKATVKIAADCAIGEHWFRVRTASGVSTLRTFWVGAWPIIAEKEPNNDLASAQPIPLNVTVDGIVQGEDVDYFVVEAKKGQRITAEIEAMRLGNYFDPSIAILDAKRFVLASADDVPLLGQDACTAIIAPEDGKYFIQVRECSYGGNSNCNYRLNVGTMPRPLAVFPLGGKAGEEVTVRFLGDVAGEIKKTVKLPAEIPVKRFGLFAEDEHGTAPSPNWFRVTDLPNVMATENNHTLETATPGVAPCAFNGIISVPKAIDFYKFTAKKGQTFDVRCHARKQGSPLDPMMWVFNAKGQQLGFNDDAEGSPDSYIRFAAPEDGDYVIRVQDHLQAGGLNFVYRIEVRPVEPYTIVTLQRVEYPPSQARQTIAIPQGNRMALLAQVTRYNCGGDMVFDAQNLPDKVAVQADHVPNGQTFAPVVFEAAADAPPAGKSAKLWAKPADPKITMTTRFQQTCEFSQYINQEFMHFVTTDKLAVAVIDPVPISVRIIEPKAPLVRNGSMGLKVVVDRRDGFKAPIRIQPLYNPPGVSATGEVVIPEGQTEVILPVTANNNAAVGNWKYVVFAICDLPNGPVNVSSQLAPLEIAPPIVVLNLERTASEQGKPVTLHGKVQIPKPFAGPAKIKLQNLPPKVTAPEIEITAETKEIDFALTIDPTSPPGTHKNIFCQVALTKDGEPVVHSSGYSELRIDVPIVAKKVEAATPAAAAAPAPPAAKRLTRLEQLRKEQEEREKTGKTPEKN